jgi:acyl dehydratase
MRVGDVLREERYVSRRDIRRYALSIGANDAVHHDVEAAKAAGFGDLVAPSSFYCSLGLSLGRLVGREALGSEGLPLVDELSGRRVVAGETLVNWYGDILANTEIDVEQTLTEIEKREGSRGVIELYRYRRRYLDGNHLLVEEQFTRIAR